MNHLAHLQNLHNRYFALRHGKSEANELGIIVSDPANGIPNYGLVPEGRQQVRQSAARAAEKRLLNGQIAILTSDFLRARESAVIAADIIGCAVFLSESALRERFFGAFEGTSDEHYGDVWRDDTADPNHTNNDVESAESVLKRTTSLIRRLEASWRRWTFLLVSHGDALQILQTGFGKTPASRHRSLPHLETAEIRELTLAMNSTPFG